jgi:hypothetical protein
MSSTVRELLGDYVANRVRADRVIAAVAMTYYRERKSLKGEGWRELIAVIERGAPGVVELAAAEGKGFEIKLAERPFPAQYEQALKAAAQKALSETPANLSTDTASPAPAAPRGFLARIVDRVKRLFS